MKIKNYIVILFRIALGLLFLFSGFVKAVDPWGLAIKLSEYFSAFGIGWLNPMKFAFSIMISGVELMLGLMLIFGSMRRLTSLLTLTFMLCMTLLTFYSAIFNPVTDCGCFGDAVKLTNWETFFKNIVLLSMTIVVWKGSGKWELFRAKHIVQLVAMAFFSFGIGVYCYGHLPLIDFLPYKVGTNLRQAEPEATIEEVEPKVIYRDKLTGERQTFSLDDTTWYDSDRWEWVETLDNSSSANIVNPSTRDFAIYYDMIDVTNDFVNFEGRVVMVIAADLADINGDCMGRLDKVVRRAVENNETVICLTTTPHSISPEIVVGDEVVRCYNTDGVVLKSILRAKVGVVVLEDGVILDKKNCRDL